MNEREQLERAVAALETQRATLGDVAVDVAQAGLRQKLAALAAPDIPDEVSARHKAGLLAGERKLVTVMFADISGFSALFAEMDPESVRDVVNGCFERLVPIVKKYGGMVDKFIGDEIMALFGAPVAHENDPERALRAALDILDALAAFNAEQSTQLGMHIGIATGPVIAGGIGTSERQEYSVVGEAVTVASRLEDVSEEGEILVGPDTLRLTAPLFAFEAREPVRIKGQVEPVQVYRLLGPESKAGRTRGMEAQGISSPLVGRDADFVAIDDCIDRLLDGQGGIVSVIGEAGVGKSRLMAEIRERRGAVTAPVPAPVPAPLQWLEGRTLSFGQTISYWPFQEILWQCAGITEDDSETEAWRKLQNRVGALFAQEQEVVEILPYLATLLTLEVKDEYAARVKHLDSEALGRQVFFASRRFFERLAQAQPVVLVFEDLHWVDASSALLLEYLFPLVESVPLLIIGLSRPDPSTLAAHLPEIASRDYGSRYTGVRLAALSQADSAQLVRNLLEIDDLPSNVREMIVRKAEGNPFYLEEIIRTLVDVGAVARDPETGRWQATAQIDMVAIPDTIQGVIMARVDRLDENAKQALRAAAVIGRSFLYRILHTVAEADRQLDRYLTELQAVELIHEKQHAPELEYIFKHALAQETMYESILTQRRRELHARVGWAIETLFADRLEEFYGLLAYHYARAEAWDKAQDYLLRAGDQAGRMAADTEALAHYRQALSACERAFGDQWKPLQRAALERKMGEVLFRRGEHAQALDYLHRALAYLGQPLPASRWRVWLAILGQVARQIGHRLLPGLFLKRAGGPSNPVVEEAVRSYEPIGWIGAFMNPELLLLVALKSLNVSERCGLAYGAAKGSTGLGVIMDIIPLWRLAEGYHRRAVAIAKQARHAGALNLAYFGLASHEHYVGQGDAAIEHIEQTAEAYQEIGNLHEWGNAKRLLATLSNYLGRPMQALAYCQDVVRLGREGGDLQVVCWGLVVQGFSLRRLGRQDEAVMVLREAVALAEAIPDHATLVEASGELGRCYLRQGDLQQALSTLHASQQFYVELGAGWGTSTPLRNGLAEAYLAAAEQASGAERDDWLKKASRACRDALKQGKAFRPGMPEAMRLRGIYEWQRGKPSAAQKWQRRSLSLAVEIGQRYDLGLVHLEMGQRSSDRARLERAEEIFAEIGAAWDLARVREIMDEIE